MLTDNDNLKKSSGYVSLDDMLKLAIDIAGKTVGYSLIYVEPEKKTEKEKTEETGTCTITYFCR